MPLSGDEFLRLESLIFRPVSTRPDWLKAWRNEANYLLFLAREAKRNPAAAPDDEVAELLGESFDVDGDLLLLAAESLGASFDLGID
jgi:hypothetical protein